MQVASDAKIDVPKSVAWILALIPASYFLASAIFAGLYFDDYAADTPQLIRYLIAPALLFLFFIGGAIFLSARIAAAIGAAGLAILAALFLFEALMSARLLMTMMGMFGAGAPALDAQRPVGLAVSYTPKHTNSALGLSTLNEAFLGGIPHSRVTLCVKNGQPVVYDADRFGFNNPDSVHDDRVEIMVVGDSFVEGHCLPPGRNLMSRVRGHHPNSVGLGMRGTGPLHQLAMLGRFGPELRPKTVVIAFFEGNDWKNLRNELRMPWLAAALNPGADFGHTVVPADRLAQAEQLNRAFASQQVSALTVFRRTQFVRNFFALNQSASQMGLSYPKVTHAEPAYAEILKRSDQVTRSWGGKLYLAYIPRMSRYVGLISQDFVYDRLRARVLAAAADAQVEVVDLSTVFGSDEQPTRFYAEDAHLSDIGAEVAAATISRFVERSRTADARRHGGGRS